MVIKTTYPNVESSKKLADILLNEKLAACVQFSEIESCYLWEEKIVHDKEILVTIKTKSVFYEKIENIINHHHEYEIPQIFGIMIDKGSENYLNWIDSNLKKDK